MEDRVKQPQLTYTSDKSPNDDIVGKLYIDPEDSGDLLMRVAVIDAAFPDRHVHVQPVGEGPQRIWALNGKILRPLIAAFETQTLPKMRNALLASADSAEQLRPCDVDRVVRLAKDFGVPQAAFCQWLLTFDLLPRTKSLLAAQSGLTQIVCPDCQSLRVAGPSDGFYDCQDCGRCFKKTKETSDES